MRGKIMAHFEPIKVDKLITNLTLVVLISGGLMVHVLTSLTINSYYSSPWGLVSFLLPGFAEIYLLAFQLNANMFYYKLILTGFSVLSGVVVLTWLLKYFAGAKVEKSSIQSPPHRRH